MKPIFFAVIAAAALSGCSIHSQQRLATVRAAGVHYETVEHLSDNTPLTPSDLIDLNRRGISDSVAIRHLDRVGLDYEARKEDIDRLRSAKVSDRVREAFVRASDRYVYWRSYAPPAFYATPFPWYEPYGFGFGVRYTTIHHHRCR